MGNIQVLDDLTIDKIAAGEVIERPASVVKELVENSIDSKASAITVEIKDGGISLIRITDNGCGIEAEDVPTAFLRHATSKIRSAIDLLNIGSLGFRGEALSSIAAVTQVELITKTASALEGTRYMIAGGKEQSIEHIGCPEGTTFIVRNLFYNVPARQKFLKSAQTEGAHIYDLIQQLALSHPEISFQFIMNGQNRFHTSGNGNIKDIIYSVYGKDVAKSLLPISFNHEGLELEVTGYVGKPIVSRGNRSYENYYINQRYIKSGVVFKAVEDAYKNFTMVHRFPFVCLNFSINPEALDVNVHPQKMELKFRDERTLYDTVKAEIRKVLLNQDLIPDVSIDKEKKLKVEKTDNIRGAQPFETQRKVVEQAKSAALSAKAQMKTSFSFGVKEENTSSVVSPDTKYSGANSFSDKEEMVVNRVPEKNVVNQTDEPVQSPKDLFTPKLKTVTANTPHVERESGEKESFFDIEIQPTHAAKIQAMDEAVKEITETDQDVAKPATKPVQMTLQDSNGFFEQEARPDHRVIGQLFKTYWLIEYDHKLFIMDQHAAHEKVNYERFMKRMKNKTERYVQQVSPPIVVTMSPKEAVTYEEYKDYFADFGFEIEHFGDTDYMIHGVPTDLYGIADEAAFVELLDEIMENVHGTDTTMIADKIATMACKASVKGGQKLTFEEADKLIDELLTLESPFTCPHGRPTIISMTQTEIEKKFKRIQDR